MKLDTIYNEDCLLGMQRIPDGSIDLTVTSPPYDNLRSYNGYSFNFERTARELYRATKQGGVVVWVVGDATVKGSETGSSFRQALFFKECGFNLHDTMIYHKEGPPLTHNRYEQKFEYMFVLSKGKPSTFNGIREASTRAGAVRTASWTMRQDGDHLSNRGGKGVVSDNKLRGNVWKYAIGNNGSSTDKIAHRHPAIFPEKLASDHITSWSNPCDIVLDPFMGSGTTAKCAMQLGRSFIGFEVSTEYWNIAMDRIAASAPSLSGFDGIELSA